MIKIAPLFILHLFLINIQIVYSQNTCRSIIPETREDCFKFSNQTTYCCHFTSPENSFFNHCEEINGGDYLTSQNSTISYKVEYQIDCGRTYSKNNMLSCGSTIPSSMSDCSKYSTYQSSCCYYNFYGKKGCVLNDYKVDRAVMVGNIILQCSGYSLGNIFNYWVFILVLIFTIFQ
jgi:hypothetical protein